MMPKVLIMATLFWAEPECKAMFEGKAEVVVRKSSSARLLAHSPQHIESKSRQELVDDFKPGGRYSNITAIYHEHLSEPIVGKADARFFDALPESCKWFAHKGAGYDSVDVQAARRRGE